MRTESPFKRLSDVLRWLWLQEGFVVVVFNDLVLQCQRTGTTSLPIASTAASRTNSLQELQGKATKFKGETDLLLLDTDLTLCGRSKHGTLVTSSSLNKASYQWRSEYKATVKYFLF